MPTAAGLYYFVHQPDNYKKPPIILVHGAGGTHLYWPPQIRRLHNQRIYAVDLPGHGKSEGIGRQSVADYAQNIVDFMRAISLRAAVLVGHSMGSAIALTLALDQPKRVLGVGLVGSGARLRVAAAILDNAANPATFPLAVQTVIEWGFGPNASPRLKELATQRMAETRPTVLHGDFLACDTFDVMERLSEIRVPTLIICGTEDKLTPPRYAEHLRDHIPSAHLHLIEGAGHMVMLEQPSAVAEALAAFVDRIPYHPQK